MSLNKLLGFTIDMYNKLNVISNLQVPVPVYQYQVQQDCYIEYLQNESAWHHRPCNKRKPRDRLGPGESVGVRIWPQDQMD